MNSSLSPTRDIVKRYSFVGGWLAVFLATVFAYIPGLTGPFVFDDFGTLGELGDYGGIVDWHTFKSFVFGGDAGPTGRPLSLLTFLVDANNWPAASFPFKRTNLIIHILNGALLGYLTLRILEVTGFDRPGARKIALVSAACWLLHPFLVSSTLYIVQRMAQLSTMFIFVGLIGYLHGRVMLPSRRVRAYLWMSGSIGVCTVLSMISKENGILLPLLVGTAELTIFASQPRFGAPHRAWSFLFLAVPALIIALYLGKQFLRPDFFDVAPPRDFSLWERLLTQPRIVADYLQHWFLPKLYTTGVFQDHIVKSTGWLAPISTLFSWFFHMGLIAVALIKRRAWPVFAFAILFFYGAHLLESTVINLELYFEHRNYAAAAFLLLPLIVLAHDKLGGRPFTIAAVVLLVLLGGFTRYSSAVWSDYNSMVEASARKAPTSARAQTEYARLLFDAGHAEESIRVIDKAIAIRPDDNAALLVNRMLYLCLTNRLSDAVFHDNARRVSRLPFDSRALRLYKNFPLAVAKQSCPNISIQAVLPMFADMLTVPYNADPENLENSHVQFLVGYVEVYSGRPAEARKAFEKSLDSRPGASHAMAMAALMATAGFNQDALGLSDRALVHLREAMADETRLVHEVRESDILAFQETVRRDLALSQGAGMPDQAE